MISPQLQKILVISIVIFCIAYFGYSLFTEIPDPSIQTDFSNTEIANQDVLILVDQLKNVSLDKEKEIFTSNLFTSLKDFTVPVLPEVQGRPNPFAPIGTER